MEGAGPGGDWLFLLLGRGPVFYYGVFGVPKNEILENKKTTCYAGGGSSFSVMWKTSNDIIKIGSPTVFNNQRR